MSQSSPLLEKSFSFSLRIVTFCRLLNKQKEYVFSRQLVRSGTSIGANIEEAQQAQSRKDFIHKLSIALKEACETRYWLRLLRDSQIVGTSKANEIIILDDELIRILSASIKTLKK